MKSGSEKNKEDVAAIELQKSNLLQNQIKKLIRSRTRLIVCFWTLPVYALGVWLLLNSGRSIDLFMLIYMTLYVVFALEMSLRRCPGCGEQFFVKTILLNLLTKQCVHCGLAANAQEEDKKLF